MRYALWHHYRTRPLAATLEPHHYTTARVRHAHETPLSQRPTVRMQLWHGTAQMAPRLEHQSHRSSVRLSSLGQLSGTRSHAIDLEPSIHGPRTLTVSPPPRRPRAHTLHMTAYELGSVCPDWDAIHPNWDEVCLNWDNVLKNNSPTWIFRIQNLQNFPSVVYKGYEFYK